MGRFEMEIKYVNSFIDRHGRRRDYLRRPGCKAVPLPGPRGSVEWIEAYLTGIAAAPDKKPRKAAGEAGSFNRLIIEFYASPSRPDGAQARQYHHRRSVSDTGRR